MATTARGPGGAALIGSAPKRADPPPAGMPWPAEALTATQRLAVESVTTCAAERPMPAHLLYAEDAATPKPAASGPSGPSSPGLVTTTHQFYEWHAALEAEVTTETEGAYRRYAAELRSRRDTLESALASLDAATARTESVAADRAAAARRTAATSGAAAGLAAERARLAEFAAALRGRLHHFEELDRLGAQFHAADLDVGGSRFLPLLKRVDECLAYVASRPQYADAAAFAAKFRALQGRALAGARAHVASCLRRAADAACAAVADAGESAREDGAETALLYVRFRAAAPDLPALIAELESRPGPEYSALLADCHGAYCEARLRLVGPVAQERIAGYAARLPLPGLARSGCAYLHQACQLEASLFGHFFTAAASGHAADFGRSGGGEEPPTAMMGHVEAALGLSFGYGGSAAAAAAGGAGRAGGPLAPLLEPLCSVLYDALRPAVVQLSDLDGICELVDVFQSEISGPGRASPETPAGGGGDRAGLLPTATRLLRDLQERLTFRAQAYIREEIAGFGPTADDTDYPRALERAYAAGAAGARPGGLAADVGGAAAGPGLAAEDASAAAAGAAAAAGVVYPPLARTLGLLAKVYRCVEPPIFAGLAQEAVAAAAEALQAARVALARRAGGGAPLDAHLFLIRHLLLLREQIAPFEADLSVVTKDLDFSAARAHLGRFFRGGSPSLTLGAGGGGVGAALMALAAQASPRVVESRVDGKRELEAALKAECEALIVAVTQAAVEPLLSFLTKVTAVRVTADAGAVGTARPLSEQAFASPAKLAAAVAAVGVALRGPLPAIAAKLKLYLPHGPTRAVLLKPIKANIAEAHAQAAALLESEYPPDAASVVGLPPAAELQAALDALG